jgi:hypothetical protein
MDRPIVSDSRTSSPHDEYATQCTNKHTSGSNSQSSSQQSSPRTAASSARREESPLRRGAQPPKGHKDAYVNKNGHSQVSDDEDFNDGMPEAAPYHGIHVKGGKQQMLHKLLVGAYEDDTESDVSTRHHTPAQAYVQTKNSQFRRDQPFRDSGYAERREEDLEEDDDPFQEDEEVRARARVLQIEFCIHVLPLQEPETPIVKELFKATSFADLNCLNHILTLRLGRWMHVQPGF